MLSIRRAFTLVEFVVVLVIIGILAAILFPVFGRPRRGEDAREYCPLNLKRISLALKQYVQDYDEKFPPASSGNGQGWANVTQPYLKSWLIFHCPPDHISQNETTDYFYNRRVAHMEEAKLSFIDHTILLGEGVPDSPTNTSLPSLPSDWIKDSSSPLKRHLEGANYAFADGHVKWIRPEKITLEKLKGSDGYTFLPR